VLSAIRTTETELYLYGIALAEDAASIETPGVENPKSSGS